MKFFRNDDGNVIILAGLLFVACIGFAALAIDVGIWYAEKRKLQLGADAGAMGGVIALIAKGQNTVIPEATYDISLNGCAGSNNCTIVAINNPPVSGPNTGNDKAVEVILSRPANLFLSGLFLQTQPILNARAVAAMKENNNCLTTLGTNGIGLNVKGGATLNALTCGVYINSTESNAIKVAGGGVINTDFVKVVGGVDLAGGGTINSSSGISQGVSPVSDPYSTLSIPAYSGCAQTNFQTGATVTIDPGVYCGGIKLVNNANLTMNPGVYIMNRGDFEASAQSRITGNGVTIILTSSTGSQYGAIKLTAGLTANLSAPTSGAMKDILFYGDRNASGVTHKLTGGTGQTLSGVAYFPSTSLEYNGQASAGGNPCFRIVALDVTLTGGTALGTSCQAAGGTIALVE